MKPAVGEGVLLIARNEAAASCTRGRDASGGNKAGGAGFAGGVEADNTAEAPKFELEASPTDYEECLACQ